MKLEVSARIVYEVISPSTLILNVQPLKSAGQFLVEECMDLNSQLKMTELFAVTGEKRFKIIEIPDTGSLVINYRAVVETQVRAVAADYLDDIPISAMPVSALSYLNPSRYCQSDKLYKFAFHKFGHIDHAFYKVMAIRDWIYANVEYSGGYTNAQTSAFDTITEQIGVCRDFAHLGVALCRALTIPARYYTGYAYQLQPADFHACFEAYIGGYWIIVDATKLVPLNGLVKIATGVDATDTAFASVFGNLQFVSLEVAANLIDAEFRYIDQYTAEQGYAYV
ncbi:Transglutaminase-like superfamily protein [compost metagenome]|uniref:transglutaminase-like domain-containing protein n=1 Tax=Pedobacter sp. ok626 TaxID=1761882 RepID=UPI00088B9E60|nr:transglutaminase family protein [Pedobacter sp. ok626]SDJ70114.1 Transglutaminase-like enzyme, putative cysteine protease [Pedobacter sp. ok626]